MSSLALVLCLSLFPQDPPETLPAGVAATVDGQKILQADYLEYLWTRFGKRALEDMIADALVEQEALAYGISTSKEEVDTALEEKERSAREHAPPGALEMQLKSAGQNLELWRISTRNEVRMDLLLDRLVRTTRVVTDQRLQDAFEIQYGKGGLRFEVSHILRMPNLLRAELLRAGTKPNEIDLQALQAQAQEEVQALLDRARNGESFGGLAREGSHDRVTKEDGGMLRNYDGRLYGVPFREAVESLQEGGISDPVKSGAGWHIVQLLARHQTDLETVRPQVIEAILTAEPTWQEKRGFVQGLRARAKVQLW